MTMVIVVAVLARHVLPLVIGRVTSLVVYLLHLPSTVDQHQYEVTVHTIAEQMKGGLL